MLKYQVSSKSVQWKPSCFMETHRLMDVTKLIATFRSFANTPKKGEVFPVHTMKAYWGSTGTAADILNLGTREVSGYFTPAPLSTQEKNPSTH